tara:strand:- start:1695 stop:2045 length:351 start_codon:yes stop_codon:yes gene_type:complete
MGARKKSINDATPEEWNKVTAKYTSNGTVWSKDSDKKEPDAVNSPAHYTFGEIETIDYIVDVLGVWGAIEYCHGNVLKYTGSRMFNKGKPVQDAKKAVWYLNKIIELIEGNKDKFI